MYYSALKFEVTVYIIGHIGYQFKILLKILIIR